MEKLFVPYEIAKRLQEKGFDEPCLVGMRSDRKQIYSKVATMQGKNCVINWDKNDDDLPLPLYQQAVDFFRKKHEIIIEISESQRLYSFELHKIGWLSPEYESGFRRTGYYETLTDAIEEALKLI